MIEQFHNVDEDHAIATTERPDNPQLRRLFMHEVFHFTSCSKSCERLVRRADPRPAEIGGIRSHGDRAHEPAARIAELRSLVGPELDSIAIFVDITMMEAAQ